MKSIEMVQELIIHGRVICSFAAEEHVLSAFNSDIKTLRNFFLKKLSEHGLGVPRKEDGSSAHPPYFKNPDDFYYQFEMHMPDKDFIVFAKIALVPTKSGSRENPGGTFHVLDVVIKLKDS